MKTRPDELVRWQPWRQIGENSNVFKPSETSAVIAVRITTCALYRMRQPR